MLGTHHCERKMSHCCIREVKKSCADPSVHVQNFKQIIAVLTLVEFFASSWNELFLYCYEIHPINNVILT